MRISHLLILFFCLYSMQISYIKAKSELHQSFIILPAYTVYKIDSIYGWELIYCKKNDSLFKIVSKKESVANCNKIALGRQYDFELYSYSKELLTKFNLHPSLAASLGGIGINDSTTINFERDSINDLYFAKNIRGLCFINN